ncbi:hypothetical protein LTR37_008522 [Vermiconidia calcicola]|uniref:Uncharacterized protein n=1 Tax=Vermiconidia calcicola TaxID=1690605 RepID=A0ACC3NAE8_9PEZI|nr:hypothetical protein LTR37_008522 [Vermiconidia calcicola]
MAGQPDLTLPDRIADMERYHEQPENILPFALYTLCELGDQEVEGYRRICASECDDDMVKLPPQSRFVGELLQTVVDYHMQLARGGEFDPTYFIVCAYHGSTSVVVVTLDDDEMECKPDRLWVKMNEAGLLLVSLQIANTDWSEAKEGDLRGPTWPDNDDDAPSRNDGDNREEDGKCDDQKGDDQDHSRDFNNRSQKDKKADDATTRESSNAEDEDAEPGDQEDSRNYGNPPPQGFHIQLYTVPGVNEDDLVRKIEPSSHYKKADQSDWVTKVHCLPKNALRDPTRYAADLHPHRCATHPTLVKEYFIVADEPNFHGEGVAIVHIDWNGKTEGRTKDQLLDFGASLRVEIQRAEVPETATRAAVATVCTLAQGYLKWQPKVKQFAIYHQNASDADIKLAKAIDSNWVKRGHGEARVALGGSIHPDEIVKSGGLWPALIRRHVAYCKRQKFMPGFVRQYFIWCYDEAPSAGSEVQVVRLHWDGDLRAVETLVEDYERKASSVEIVASKAHRQLTDVAEGTVEWQGRTIARLPAAK